VTVALHDRIYVGSPEFVEIVAVELWRDARLLSAAPAESLAASRSEIEEAREALNDALAKIDRKIAA
jgi:hypothetical protein